MLCRAIIMAMTVVLGRLWRALGLDVKGPGQADDGLGHLHICIPRAILDISLIQ